MVNNRLMKVFLILLFTLSTLQVNAARGDDEELIAVKNGVCVKSNHDVSESKNLKPMITFISKYNERFWPYLEKLKKQKKVTPKVYFGLKRRRAILGPRPPRFDRKAGDGGSGTGTGGVVEY
ncbi:hypothetical protein A9Q84_17475 [Halobacteriovorax marinus]|uniref:Uncharacterized protein n=1 Tax=Halobacteriovorax marinus TaxID=97084 RepID=A0A1Y5F328_9BACT|nr:hypothetical protein A9Q84_17475 [Halobacteriovorax marinus]